jgi:hypothetical protein
VIPVEIEDDWFTSDAVSEKLPVVEVKQAPLKKVLRGWRKAGGNKV